MKMAALQLTDLQAPQPYHSLQLVSLILLPGHHHKTRVQTTSQKTKMWSHSHLRQEQRQNIRTLCLINNLSMRQRVPRLKR